jgi:CheY-like chemotaxis protein
MADKKNILLVEDNPEFFQVAESYLKTQDDIGTIHIAPNHRLAELNLKHYQIDAAIIDCFFPQDILPGKELGYSTIEKMLSTDSESQNLERRAETYSKAFENIIDMNDIDMKRFARYIAHESGYDNPHNFATFMAIEMVGKTLGKEATTWLTKNNMNGIFKNGLEKFKDSYKELRDALDRDDSNAPLGILVAEECVKRNIPFVLATSTYHHDNLTQPIYDYCNKRGWKLIDCDKNSTSQKNTSQFWDKAYSTLLKEMEKK